MVRTPAQRRWNEKSEYIEAMEKDMMAKADKEAKALMIAQGEAEQTPEKEMRFVHVRDHDVDIWCDASMFYDAMTAYGMTPETILTEWFRMLDESETSAKDGNIWFRVHRDVHKVRML